MHPVFHTLKAVVLLVTLGFIWGSGYSLAKLAMTNGVSPLGYSFWQSLGPACVLILCSLPKCKKSLLNVSHWPYFLICGLIGIAIPNTNMYFIAEQLPAGLLAVLVNTVPLLVYPLALFFKQEKADIWRFLALVIGLIGILLMIDLPQKGFYSYWTLLALISPISFAACSVYIGAQHQLKLHAVEAACGMLSAAALMLAPLVLQQHAFYPLTPPYTLAKQVIILEIILSSIGYLLFFMLIRQAGPVFYSLTGGAVAITGLLWDYYIFSERPTTPQILAILLIIFAICLLSWRQSKRAKDINLC